MAGGTAMPMGFGLEAMFGLDLVGSLVVHLEVVVDGNEDDDGSSMPSGLVLAGGRRGRGRFNGVSTELELEDDCVELGLLWVAGSRQR